MPKTPEQFYTQHQEDAEKLKKAKEKYDKHLESARKANNIAEHPKVWDQASEEYQEEIKKRIAEAVQAQDYDKAEELIKSLKKHLTTTEKSKEQQEKTEIKKSEFFTPEELKEITNEGVWQRAKNRVTEMIKNNHTTFLLGLLAEMKTFDKERFNNEIEITDKLWKKLKKDIEAEKMTERLNIVYLSELNDLRKLNPKLFNEKVSISDEEIEQLISENTRKIEDFLLLASTIKEMNPIWFKKYIATSDRFKKEIWPAIKKQLLKSQEDDEVLFMINAERAQSIKPAGEPDIVIDSHSFEKIKETLKKAKERGIFSTFFSVINKISNLKVSKK